MVLLFILAVLVAPLRRHRLVEALEDEVGKAALHELQVHVLQNVAGLGFHDADIVDAARTNPNDLLVHEGLDQFGHLLNLLNPVVIRRV